MDGETVAKWKLSESLFVRWHSCHGLSGSEEAWNEMDEWTQGYWHGVAEYVLDNFHAKAAEYHQSNDTLGEDR